MKLGRFIVDTHVHSQRHAAGKALKGSRDFADLGHAMYNIEAYDSAIRIKNAGEIIIPPHDPSFRDGKPIPSD